MATIRFMSMNCRGLGGPQKRRDVINFLRHSPFDIIFLQDTHFINNSITNLDRLWPGKGYHSCKTSNSRGTSILIRQCIQHNVVSELYGEDGNLVIIVCEISSDIYTLVSVYGPNEDKPTFYKDIDKLLQKLPNDNVIIAGDFNLVMNLNCDSNYLHDNNASAKKELNNIIHKYELVDVWRHFHPTDKDYTWMKPTPLKYGRIDMYFISDHLKTKVHDSGISAGYRTDHNMISLTLGISEERRGPGIWKFNDSLLQDESYTLMVKDLIIDIVKQYAIPVYSQEFFSNIKNFENVQFTLDIKLFYETLLMMIRGETVKFSKQKARKTRKEECEALENINKLKEIFAQSNSESDAIELHKAQKSLEKLREPKINGLITRSRVRWHDEGERSTKYFLSLEKVNGKRKSLQKLSIDGNTVYKKAQILSAFSNHFKKRYSSVPNDCNPSISDFVKRNIRSRLSIEQKLRLEEPISMNELTSSLMLMKSGKSPGSNGFTASFFKYFWDHIGTFLFRTFKKSVEDLSFPRTFREAVITLIPKIGKPTDSIKGWRPISLLNVDFKIISAAITTRLKSVMDDVISASQSAYMKGRCIAENTRLVYDVIQKLNEEKRSGLVLAADFESAFESISWNFLNETLECFNFGQKFIRLLRTAYLNKDNYSRIILHGYLGEAIAMNRGIRQGDPASGYLFNLAVEPLANHILQSPRIQGIRVQSKEIRLSQYADDLIIFLDNQPQAVNNAIAEIQTFSKSSGLHLNVEKTKCLPIGVPTTNIGQDSLRIQYVNELNVLGIIFQKDNAEITTNNLKHKIIGLKKDIQQWSRRHITLLGKVTVIKSLLLSKLVHVFLSLPTPSENDIRQIETMFFRFLWDDKPDRVKRSKMIQQYNKDGIEMVDLKSFIQSMKITWIKRLIESRHDWTTLMQKELCHPQKLLMFGPTKLSEVIKHTHNPFWKQVLMAWRNYRLFSDPDCHEMTTEALWFSDLTKFKKSIVKAWDKRGLRFIGDLINNETGVLYTREELERVYGIHMTFLCYSSLVKSLPKEVKATSYKSLISYPLIPYPLKMILAKEKISRKAYAKYVIHLEKTYHKAETTLESKWMRDVGHFQKGTLVDVRTVTKNTYLQSFHFRLTSRIIATNSFLHKIGRIEDDKCTFCGRYSETLYHLFF